LTRAMAPSVKQRSEFTGRWAAAPEDRLDDVPLDAIVPMRTPMKKLRKHDLAKIGQAFIDETRTVIDAAGHSKALKRSTSLFATAVAKRSTMKFGKIAKLVRARLTGVKASCGRSGLVKRQFDKVEVCLTPDKGGHPKRRKLCTDAELDTMLVEHSKDTCRWSHRADRPMKALLASVSKTWSQSEELQSSMALRTLQKRLKVSHDCSMGYGKAVKRVDTCKVCSTWDNLLRRTTGQAVKEARALLLSLAPIFFEPWKQICLDNDWDDERPLMLESLAYVEALSKYIQNHRGDHPDMWSGFAACQVDDLSIGLEVVVDRFTKENGILQTVTLMHEHWSLRDHVAAKLRSDVDNPKAGTLYLWYDYEERNRSTP
jgi:hypothetical protein